MSSRPTCTVETFNNKINVSVEILNEDLVKSVYSTDSKDMYGRHCSKSTSIAHVNINHIMGKIHQVKLILDNELPGIFCLSETFLNVKLMIDYYIMKVSN